MTFDSWSLCFDCLCTPLNLLPSPGVSPFRIAVLPHPPPPYPSTQLLFISSKMLTAFFLIFYSQLFCYCQIYDSNIVNLSRFHHSFNISSKFKKNVFFYYHLFILWKCLILNKINLQVLPYHKLPLGINNKKIYLFSSPFLSSPFSWPALSFSGKIYLIFFNFPQIFSVFFSLYLYVNTKLKRNIF